MPEEAQSSLRALSALEGIFNVPDYQRGYRWGEDQIETFLDDITKARDRGEKSYFLQAIVVKKIGEKEGQPVWELIDGQQRLTTAWLLGQLLHKRYPEDQSLDFSLDYKSRPDSAIFLRTLAETGVAPEDTDSNVDFWHMAQAMDVMRDWAVRERKLATFYEFFRENVQLLWHEDGPEADAASHFVSLNSGRIPLQDAELCRAVLLAGKHMNVDRELPPELKKTDEDLLKRLKAAQIRNHQILMGSAWDRIERELREKPLWGFLNGPADLPVHMDYLLQIIFNKNEFSGQHPCFNEIEKRLYSADEPQDSIAIWNRISFEFDRLACWFQDNNYYHWLGYLSALKLNRNEPGFWHKLLESAGNETEERFKKDVLSRIRAAVFPRDEGENLDLEAFEYGQQGTENMLLLFNVEYARRAIGLGVRFPFHEHNRLRWSLEHINAQNIDMRNDQEAWRKWLDLHIHYLSLADADEADAAFEAFLGKCRALVKQEKITAEEFRPLRAEIEAYVGSPVIRQDSVLNLVLLDLSKNAALSNSIFAIKKGQIQSWLSYGEDLENPDNGDFYVPIGTQAVLMRHFTDGSAASPIWSPEDMEGYRRALENILSFYWPSLRAADDQGERP